MTPRRTGIRWLNVTAGGVWFLASLLPFLFLGWKPAPGRTAP